MNGIPCVYLGFDDRNNQYKVKEWVSGRIYYTADLTFHGKVFPYRANPQLSEQWMHEMDAVTPRVPVSAANPAPSMPPVGPRRSHRVHEYQFSNGQDVRTIPDVPAPPDVSPASMFVHSFGPDPATWNEAMESRHANDWVAADLMEKNSLFHEHGTLEIVPRAEARGRRVFRSKSVFKIKINPPGVNATVATIEKFKVRVTIAALTKLMRPGIDYAEKRASTVRWEAVLALLAIAAAKDLEITLFDIATFFLYGELQDEIYMEQVSRWVDPAFPASDFIYRLRGNLYGLPQASHIAQGSLRECLTANGTFRSTTADDCVYVRSQGKSEYVATGTHVDDLPAVGTVSGLKTLEDTLRSKFKITVKPNPDVIMGVQVERDRANRSIKLHQQMYIEGILREFNMQDSKPMDTPIDPGMAKAMMLLPTDSSEPKVLQKYQRLVGMLIWLHKTRVDMLFTINFLSRFLKCATQQHLDYATGRPLRYLRGATKLGIVLKPGANVDLSAESDADWAGDLQSGRSTVGGYIQVGEQGAIACSSTLDRRVSTAVGQSETLAAAAMGKRVEFARHLFGELEHEQVGPTPLGVDNNGVFLQSTKQVNHTEAKHYRLSQAYVRSLDQEGTIKVHKVNTQDNHADLFTKALGREAFIKHRNAIMGVQDDM
jgi:hypothetical protein